MVRLVFCLFAETTDTPRMSTAALETRAGETGSPGTKPDPGGYYQKTQIQNKQI
jgi:hypothetical protein